MKSCIIQVIDDIPKDVPPPTHIADNHFNHFSIYEDKFLSLVLGCKETISIDPYDEFPPKFIFTFKKSNFMDVSFKVLLLYYKNRENANRFFEYIMDLIYIKPLK